MSLFLPPANIHLDYRFQGGHDRELSLTAGTCTSGRDAHQPGDYDGDDVILIKDPARELSKQAGALYGHVLPAV